MKFKDRIHEKRSYKQVLLATCTTFTLGVNVWGGTASAAVNIKGMQQQSQRDSTIKNETQFMAEKSIGKVNLSKIKADLDNQKQLFEENKQNLFIGAGLGITNDNIVSLEHEAIINKKVAQRIAGNMKKTYPEFIPKIEELRKTLSKDEQIGKVDNMEDVIKELIIHWNKFVDRPLVKAIQLAAMKQFHLPYANLDRWKEDKLGEYESHIDTLGIILEEIKNETQSFLKNKGIKELTLFRGVKSPTKMNENGVDVHPFAALSSFSFSKGSSEDYAVSSNPAIHPYLLVKNIPVDRILSLGVTGFGLMEHYEVVVLGGMYSQDECFVLPGKTGSQLELFLGYIVKTLQNRDFEILKQQLNVEAEKQVEEHAEEIANQIDKIIKETPDLTVDKGRDQLYTFLIGAPLQLEHGIAHEITNVLIQG
ncbi:hypothetical protein [Bacillus wiedmannii]|uniref:hypothetical protein n=1 Tax=Bacillus wiedmannii TaxID=1890302 RepID=UPI000BECC90C|nr:hypothetical protein [Bacillus wiedmannii]PEF42564.1 hypothetical protein CON72_03125 [Bacillus wiedmannii]